jgi:DNA-binding transcriptional MocR family regulator
MTRWTPDLSSRHGALYLEIADAIARDIANGRLPPGARLPTHRDLADRLGVTVGTVSRGYAEAARRGLLSGEVGRGTFARRPAPGAPLRPASGPVEIPLIDLSVNHPPVQQGERETAALGAALSELSSQPALSSLMAYQPDGGAHRHRAAGAAWINRCDLEATADRVLVCSGSQHATATLFATLLRPGDLVLTEALTHPGFKILANLLHLRLQGVAMDGEGIRPDSLEAACRAGSPRALYCLPTIHNPTTGVMPEPRRRDIAGIAQAHGLAIVEDDIHGVLPPRPVTPLSAFAPESSYYITSTSKSIAPGLRIGYLLAPLDMVDRLAAAIRATTWMAPPLMAEIATRWIEDGTAEMILAGKREEAAARQVMARQRLGGADYRAHPNGYHLWLQLPDPWRSDTFTAQAHRHGVAVTPAEAFLVGRGGSAHAVRVCLGGARDRADLDRGLSLLAETLNGPPEAAPAIV